MNPNQSKDQDYSKFGKNPQDKPREKRHEDKSMERPDVRDEMNDPVGTPETNQPPPDDRKGKPDRQNLQPRRHPSGDERPLQDPGVESDVLKPGR